MEKSPSLEGLGIDFYIPRRNQEFSEVLPTLLMKLPFGLKWLKIKLKADNLSSLFCSEAMKTLQDLSIDPWNFNPETTDLPMFSAPELIKFEYQESNAIPDQILRSLAMNSPKLKEVSLTVPDKTDGQAVYFPLRGLEKVCIVYPFDEFVEIVCRNNRNLQSIELGNGSGLTTISMTHLSTLEHLTNIEVWNYRSDRFCTLTSLLSFLRNRASRPKNIGFFTRNISNLSNSFDIESQQLLELRDEIERQKLEDGSLICISYTDQLGNQVYIDV